MSARIVFTVGGMAINARHRRDVEPAYRTGEDAATEAVCDWRLQLDYCPGCSPERYAAKHRAEVAS